MCLCECTGCNSMVQVDVPLVRRTTTSMEPTSSAQVLMVSSTGTHTKHVAPALAPLPTGRVGEKGAGDGEGGGGGDGEAAEAEAEEELASESYCEGGDDEGDVSAHGVAWCTSQLLLRRPSSRSRSPPETDSEASRSAVGLPPFRQIPLTTSWPLLSPLLGPLPWPPLVVPPLQPTHIVYALVVQRKCERGIVF